MATIKLGAIITQIAGSVGGTTFKRNGSSLVMMNKNFGGSYQKQLANPRLNQLKNIFQRFDQLDSQKKEFWKNKASGITFPNKFGDNVHINGRQLFTKLNAQLLPTGTSYDVTDDFDSVVPEFTISNPFINIFPPTAVIEVNFVGTSQYVCIQAEVSSKGFNSPIFNRRKILVSEFTNVGGTVNFGTEFWREFPFVNNNYEVRIYVFLMNAYGFRNTPKIVVAPVIYIP